ncbi:cupin domain-containing protein [Candidatus Saccharibacteria bacterium]|nr:cupin domain-containing protein [Candidatus Saccharibacteria bacterium]
MARKWVVEHINDIPPMRETFSRGWKSVRWHMGIESFGVNGVTKPKGEWLTPIHDEKDGNQDELFVVLEGRAEFHLDKEKITATAGTLVSVKPSVKRGVLSAKTPTTILIIGAPIGKVYKPVSWA